MVYSQQVETVLRHIQETYGVTPDFLWAGDTDSAALRHHGHKKWFGALLLNLPAEKLGLEGGTVDILNLKCDPRLGSSLRDGRHFFPAWHMNKEHWISVLLDADLPMDTLTTLIEMSYRLTNKRK